jgi:hypothetical protein
MRTEYYNLIKEKSISDILSEIDFLSYSYKKNLLELLLKRYNPLTINLALNEYKLRYIDCKRIDTNKLRGQLIYYCKQFNSI